MNILLILLFLAAALVAAAFASLPLLRAREGQNYEWRRTWLAALVALFVAGAGLGTYFALGEPGLALRTLAGPDPNDFRSLIATLARRIRERPDDAKGWTLLARGYMALGAPDEAAKALERAIAIARAKGPAAPMLYSAYGEALTEAAGGTVTSDAEAAFRASLAADPKDAAARYYLGLAAQTRGNTSEALSYWQGLLADAPANAPWRDALIDQVAVLKAQDMQAGGPAPDINAMVQGLAARLAGGPHDLDGWERLTNAYAVLGETDKAKQSLGQARKEFSHDKNAQAALTALAQKLNLEK